MRAAKVDANQVEIVRAFRAAGASVLHLHTLKGAADTLVGHPRACPACGYETRFNSLIEIKNGALSPSKQRLTVAEAKFHHEWKGQIAIAKTIDEALAIIGRGIP